jgi:transcriptional regulator with XRE-family HTH domain
MPRRVRHLLLVELRLELGRRIKQAREEAGLSQTELADRIGLRHPQSISNYERGETEVPGKRIRRIAEVTGRPLSFFLDEEPAQDLDLLAGLRDLVARLERVAEVLEAQPARRSARGERKPA